MPRIETNTALKSIRGELDGWVFKTYRGRTFLQKKPVFTKPWSKAQAGWRQTFKAASGFAKMVKADPELREAYKRRGRRLKLNYRQMALRDAFTPPRVEKLDVSRYQRGKGGTLVISAWDDFAVMGVTITLRDATGNVVLTGDGRPAGHVWHFDVPPSANALPASVDIAARDRPGNVATRSFPLP